MKSTPQKGHTEVHHEHHENHSALRSKWVFIGFALIAGYFLITEHRAHLVGIVPYLPFLLLLACPLMHMFHHGGHGNHHDHGGNANDESKGESK